MNNTVPSKLEKCPIVDALIEIRFESPFPKSVIFGMIYSIIKEKYLGEVKQLPTSQIPEQIREADPNLKFKPLYLIEGDETIIQIGPDVIAISSKIPYKGWSYYSEYVINDINRLINKGIISKVIRVGLRYVNFFENDIMNDLTLTLNMASGYNAKNIYIRTDIPDNDFIDVIQISNTAQYHKNGITLNGTLIDIDSSKYYNDSYFSKNIEEELNKAHKSEKCIFFSLLKADFLNSLKPKYDDNK